MTIGSESGKRSILGLLGAGKNSRTVSGHAGAATKYRPDIDGLRAVAVLPVVFYHLGSSFFPGGYVGVDIFFVISGYLITGIIAAEVTQRRFSIVAFYERRVRRIFPALLAVLVVSAFLAARLLMPDEFANFGASLVSTVVFASNMLFWRQSGYFDAAASTKPLLHTWSLAVEEQFYIFFPILLFAIHRWFRERWAPWLGAIAVASFAISVIGVYKWPTATFYLIPQRTWELMIGALLALELVPALTRPILREIVAGVGLALILVAIFTFSDGTRFPGPAALLPCVGAGAIIHAGRSGSTLVGRLLSTKFFVGFGLISYSLYLWHWPLIVFAKAWLIRNPTTSEAILIFCASVGAATFSWAFIERPFRGRDRVFRRNSLFLASGIAMCCLALFGAFGKMSHGWPGRLPDRVVELAAFKHSQDPRRMKCLADAAHSIAVKDACVYGADVPPTYAVWGDSHSGAIMQALGEVAASKQKAIKFIGYGGCVPVIGLDVKLARSCLPHNQEALEFLKNEASIKTVILIGRYVAYLYGTDVDSDPDGERIPLIRKADGSLPTVSEAEQLFDEQFRQTVTALLDAGKNVVLVYPIPDAGFDVPSTLATLELRAKDPAPFILDRDAYLRSQRKILEVLDGVKPDNRVSRIYPADLLCAEKKCIVTADGTPLYRDHTHLNMIGSRYVARLFETTFSQ